MVRPVSVSPLMMAKLMGAAPRYCGSSEAWRQHPERHHDEQIGLVGSQLLQKRRVFQLLGLQQGESMLQRGLLDVGILYLASSPGRFVGHGDDDSDLIAGFEDGLKLRGSEFGGAEIGDSDVVFHGCQKKS